MLAGLGKPVFGYTNKTEALLTRVKRTEVTHFDATAKVWRDSAGMMIEDFDNADNLMIDTTLIEEGRPMVRHAAQPKECFRDLPGFETCLLLAPNTLAAAGVAPISAFMSAAIGCVLSPIDKLTRWCVEALRKCV